MADIKAADSAGDIHVLDDRRYERRMVAIMFFAWGIVFLDRMSQLYLMPYIAADLRLSDEQVGFVASAMAAATCWAALA